MDSLILYPAIEEKIKRFAQAKQNNTEQVGVASLMRLKKFAG